VERLSNIFFCRFGIYVIVKAMDHQIPPLPLAPDSPQPPPIASAQYAPKLPFSRIILVVVVIVTLSITGFFIYSQYLSSSVMSPKTLQAPNPTITDITPNKPKLIYSIDLGIVNGKSSRKNYVYDVETGQKTELSLNLEDSIAYQTLEKHRVFVKAADKTIEVAPLTSIFPPTNATPVYKPVVHIDSDELIITAIVNNKDTKIAYQTSNSADPSTKIFTVNIDGTDNKLVGSWPDSSYIIASFNENVLILDNYGSSESEQELIDIAVMTFPDGQIEKHTITVDTDYLYSWNANDIYFIGEGSQIEKYSLAQKRSEVLYAPNQNLNPADFTFGIRYQLNHLRLSQDNKKLFFIEYDWTTSKTWVKSLTLENHQVTNLVETKASSFLLSPDGNYLFIQPLLVFSGSQGNYEYGEYYIYDVVQKKLIPLFAEGAKSYIDSNFPSMPGLNIHPIAWITE